MDRYHRFGVMLDCSRNAVMRPEQVCRLIDCLQKMGYNCLELYTEDTLEVPEYPMLGHMRGAYTRDEIRTIDAYAKAHGIELIPCIQTLAHFTCPSKLASFGQMIDCNDILLAGDEKTYDFLDKLFAAVADAFSSRSINIGMDEAHMVGLGKYLDIHGYRDRFAILSEHLERVAQIAKKYGFRTHMWSDMFFRLLLKGEYYAKGVHIPAEVRARVPENVEPVYWDYYHEDRETYDAMLASHEEFGKPETWFAGGAWCWLGMAPRYRKSESTMRPAMAAVRDHGVKNVLITLWGDDGRECSPFSLLPELYSIRRYADGVTDEARIAEEFGKLFGADALDFRLLELPNLRPTKPIGDALPKLDAAYDSYAELCDEDLFTPKHYLYNDVFYGGDDPIVSAIGPVPYDAYAAALSAASERVGEWAYLFRYEAALCDLIAVKYDLGIRTRAAYKSGDRARLRAVRADYDTAIVRLEAFYEAFDALWQRENKPYGFEVQQVRLGGLSLRLRACAKTIDALLDGKIDKIEELDKEPVHFARMTHQYRNMVSSSEL